MRPQVKALKDHSQLGTELREIGAGVFDALLTFHAVADKHVLEQDLAFVILFKEIDAAEQRRLARPAGSDDADHLAGVNVERHALEHAQGAEAFPDVPDFNDRLGHGSPSR